jgi:hypothetical protein
MNYETKKEIKDERFWKCCLARAERAAVAVQLEFG